MIGVILLVLAAVAINYLQTWRKRSGTTKKTPQILGTEMKQSAQDFDAFDYYNGVLRFKIHARRLRVTNGGRSLLEDIEACDFNADGSVRNDIRSKYAEYDEVKKTADFSGDVRLFIRRQLELRTESLHYDLNSGIGHTPDLLQISSERVSGSARGVRIDQKQKTLALQSEVNLMLAPDRPGAEKLRVISQRADCSETAGRLHFQGDVQIESESQSLAGQSIEAFFNPEGKQLRLLAASNGAVYRSGSDRESWTLSGDRIDFGISAAGTLEKINVRGQAAFSSSSQSGGDELKSRDIDVEFDDKELPSRLSALTDVSFRIKNGSGEVRGEGEQFYAGFFPGTKVTEKIRIVHGSTLMLDRTPASDASELQAEEIRIALKNAGGRSVLHKLEAEGGARYISRPPGRPERSMAAHKLELFQAGDYFESGSATGKVEITEESHGKGGIRLKRLLADYVQFGFSPGTSRLRNLDGRNNVQLIYENPGGSGKDAPKKFRTESDRIEAVFDQRTGEARKITQVGHFTYEDGTRSASAGRSDYDAEKEVLVLTELDPKITDETSSTTGDRIEFNRKDGHLLVQGSPLRSVLSAKQGEAGFWGSSSSSSSAGEVTAREMRYWTDTKRIQYGGDVHSRAETQQLWADSLDIFGSFDRMEAKGSIRHAVFDETSRQSGQPGRKTADKTRKAAELLTTIRSSAMTYSKADSRISYSGKVRLQSEDLDLTSDRLDATPDAKGKGLRDVHAEGDVRMKHGERRFKGATADYSTETGKFVFRGNPAEVQAPALGRSSACQLTYSTADDTILLDGRQCK